MYESSFFIAEKWVHFFFRILEY